MHQPLWLSGHGLADITTTSNCTDAAANELYVLPSHQPASVQQRFSNYGILVWIVLAATQVTKKGIQPKVISCHLISLNSQAPQTDTECTVLKGVMWLLNGNVSDVPCVNWAAAKACLVSDYNVLQVCANQQTKQYFIQCLYSFVQTIY